MMVCVIIVLVLYRPRSLNYEEDADYDDGSCIETVKPCTIEVMFNYDPNANVNDGSCIPFIYGCTDPTMWNYNSNANTDDGSCISFIYGCTEIQLHLTMIQLLTLIYLYVFLLFMAV